MSISNPVMPKTIGYSKKSWIVEHPIAAYLLFVLPVSWAAWSLLFFVIEPGGILHDPPAIAFVLVVIGQAWASVSGILVTRLALGRDGLSQLWARLRNWRVGWWWLALLIIPALTAVTPVLRWLAGYSVDTEAMAGLLVPGLMLGLISGLAEEFGWRGYLLPQLLKKYSPLVATILLGLVWGGLWHGYADYFGLGDKGAATLPLILLLGPFLLTAWSLVITSVYERTQGSLLISILMHASLSSTALIFGQTYSTPKEEVLWNGISVATAFIGAAVIWYLTHHKKA